MKQMQNLHKERLFLEKKMKTIKRSEAVLSLLFLDGKLGEIRALLELPDSNSETDTAKLGLSQGEEFTEAVHSIPDAQVNVYTTHLLFFV